MCVCVFVRASVLQDTKMKIEKVKAYEEKLMECLGEVLEKHVPQPQNETSSGKKKKKVSLVFSAIKSKTNKHKKNSNE